MCLLEMAGEKEREEGEREKKEMVGLLGHIALCKLLPSIVAVLITFSGY